MPKASGPPGLYRLAVSVGLTTQQRTQAVDLERIAELAYSQRNIEVMERAARQLAPISADASLYFLAMVAKWRGRSIEARALLEAVRGEYQARAIQALGAIHFEAGRFDEAARFYVEAMRAGQGKDAFAVISALGQLSAIKSVEGSHERALEDLQSLWPLARLAAKKHPHLRPMLHNEIAFELLQLGRIEEARRAAAVAVASPISRQYAEWHETTREIAEAERRPFAVVVPAREGKPEPRAAAALPPSLTCKIFCLSDFPPGAVINFNCASSLIQSRVYSCAPIHAPPTF